MVRPAHAHFLGGGLALVLAVLSHGCRSTEELGSFHQPAFGVESAYGWVRAESLDRAEEYARLWEAVVPFVQGMVPGTRAAPSELWVIEDPSPANRPVAWHRGRTERRGEGNRITVFLDSFRGVESVLVHEAVHHLLDSGWDGVPQAVEEGMASWVAGCWDEATAIRCRAEVAEIVGAHLGGLTVRFRMGASSAVAIEQVRGSVAGPIGLDLPLERILLLDNVAFRQSSSSSDGMVGHVLGYLVFSRLANRVGMDAVRQASLAACQSNGLISVEWLLAHSDLDETAASWNAVLGEFLGLPEVDYFAQSIAPVQAESLARIALAWDQSLGHMTAGDVLDKHTFEMEISPCGERVRLNDEAPFKEAFERAWTAATGSSSLAGSR